MGTKPTFPVKGCVRFVVDDKLAHPLSYRCEGEDMTYYAQGPAALDLLGDLAEALAKSDGPFNGRNAAPRVSACF